MAQCLEAVRASVERVWPHATTHVFGSQAVGLAMPGSDVDMCVMDAIEIEDQHPRYPTPLREGSFWLFPHVLKIDLKKGVNTPAYGKLWSGINVRVK